MFDYVFNAYHWYLGTWPAFTHSVEHHKQGEWPGYWDVFLAFSIFFAIACAVSIDEGEGDFYTYLRRLSVCIVPLFLWPWIMLLALPVVAAGVAWLFVRAWLDKIPSKEQRIRNKANKVEELRGKVNDYA